MKNVLVIVSFLCLFLYVSSGRSSVKAQVCGFGTYEKVDQDECESASWENGCKVSSWGEKTTCITDNDNKCTALYNWSGCYVVWDRDKYKCKYEVNSSTLPCGVYGGGGGGGGIMNIQDVLKGKSFPAGRWRRRGRRIRGFADTR